MKILGEPDNKKDTSVLFGILVVLASPCALLFAIWLIYGLLLSYLITVVPIVAFLIWLVRQARRGVLKSRWKLGVVLFLGAVAMTGLIVRFYMGDLRTPSTFVLRKGYVGWFRVQWGVVGAAPLPLEEEPLERARYLLVIPESGVLTTSTHYERSWDLDKFFVVDKRGKRTQLSFMDRAAKGPVVWGVSDPGDEQVYFVGTKEQFRKVTDTRGRPRPGTVQGW